MGKREIRPIATPKPLNRSSQKVAHVITSWISTDVQNLVAIHPGISFPVCAKLRIKMFTRLFWGSSNDLQPRCLNRFSRLIRQTTRFRARMCLFSVRRQKINIYTRSSRKTAIVGPDFDRTKFSTEIGFTMGVLECKLPLIVVVAP